MGDHPQSRGRFVVWPFTHPKVMTESFLGLSQPLSWTFEDVKKVVDAVHIDPWLVSLSQLVRGQFIKPLWGKAEQKHHMVVFCRIIWIEPSLSLSLSLSPSLLICKRKQWGNKYTPKNVFLAVRLASTWAISMVKWYLRWSGSQRDGPLRDLDLVLELLIPRAKRNSQKCEGSWRTEEIASLYIVYTWIQYDFWPCHVKPSKETYRKGNFTVGFVFRMCLLMRPVKGF